MILSWWLWLLVGCIFFLIEILTPGGFYVFFFGAGAFIVGLLSAAGMAGPPWVQWLLFGSISVGALLLFRKPLQQKMGNVRTHDIDSMVGETATARTDIALGDVGRVELRGTTWNAKNVGPAVILSGQRCRVERVDGLMLHISYGKGEANG